MSEEITESLSPDKPVEDKTQDKFQRYNFSKRIADTIIQRDNEEGIVIGIYGAWGEGKTSVLNFIEEELKKEPAVLTTTLNPWRYNDEETLIRSFFNKIADLFGEKIKNKKEIVGDFIKECSALGSLVGKDLSGVGEMLSKTSLEELKHRVDKILKESDTKLVIFVDDIDRLDKNEIYSLFRIVKLTADFTRTTYILSFDEKMVASAIGNRFEAGNEQSGQNFLEKIIQVPLQIPQAQIEALKNYCFELVEKVINANKLNISKEEIQRFVTLFKYNILLRLKTPRLAIRYGNSLSFSIPLLKGEVNEVDLMLIEAIKIFYPKHYDFIKINPHYFTSSYSTHLHYNNEEIANKKNELTKYLDELSFGFTEKDKNTVLDLLKSLFPRLKKAFNNTFNQNGEEEWTKNKRIASPNYFKRYFSYTVIKGELSDIEFNDFMNSLNSLSQESIISKVEELIKKSSPNTFLYKAMLYEETLNWEAVKNLSLSLAIKIDLFPKDNSFWGFGEKYDSVTILIYNFLKNHKDKQEAFEFSKVLMNKDNIPFEFSYAQNTRLHSGKTPEEKLFNSEQYSELDKALRKKALKESGVQSIFEKFPEDFSNILSNWHTENPEDLANYLKGFIDKNPKYLKKLLDAITPIARSTNHPQPYKSDFSKDSYKYLITLLDKEYIHKNIIDNFSEDIEKEKGQLFDREDKQTEINILRQFEHWYSKDIDEAIVIE